MKVLIATYSRTPRKHLSILTHFKYPYLHEHIKFATLHSSSIQSYYMICHITFIQYMKLYGLSHPPPPPNMHGYYTSARELMR